MVIERFKKWLTPADTPASGETPQGNRLKVLSPAELLAPHEGDIAAIKARAGVPGGHWRSLYQAMFESYAVLVQRLPASESHHHAGLGGLLQHGIEVVRHTLDLKQGVILPRGEAPEVQSRVQDLWTYACVTAALLHDLGKPVTDLHVTLYGGQAGKRAWSPVQGAMPVGAHYGVEFNAQRVYRHHERIPPLLAHHLIPPAGLQWIAGDQAVLYSWLAAIQGDLAKADAIGEIVGKADGLSVARNLSGSKNVQLPTAKAKPLVERLLTGLRYLFDNNGLPMNRRGAAAYLDGDTLWLVSKTTLDKLRTHLIEEGQPGIPTRNDRLMDELQQHGLLVATPQERAIWNCEISIGDWTRELTCLRMEAAHVWSDPLRRPDSMDGHVVPTGSTASAHPTADEPAGAPQPDAQPAPKPADTAEAPPADETASGGTAQSDAVDDLPLPFDLPDDDAADTPPEPTTASTPNRSYPETRPEKTEHRPALTARDTADDQANAPAAQAADGQVADLSAEADAGERFVAWLKDSIERQTVPINTAQARIHVLSQGLALVSPRIFRDFDSANWSHAQKRFQKLRLHKKTPKDENIWTCQAAGSRKQSMLKIILIPEPAKTLGIEVPPPNPALHLHVEGYLR